MHKKVLIAFIVILLIIFSPQFVLANEVNLPKVSITPDNSLYYSFKRLFEKVITFTKFSNQAKTDYYRELSTIRMAELKNAVDQKYLSDIQQSSQRVSSQVGILTDFINMNKADLRKEIPAIQDLFNSYKSILVNLRDKYRANSSYWMLIQHSINSIDLNLEKLR